MRTIQEIETWYGQPLYDSGGGKVGEITDSLLEGETGRPAWLTIKTSGLRKKETLVPVHGASPSGDGVKVPYDESQINDAPSVKPDQELSDDDVRQLYAHYALDTDAASTEDTGDAGAASEPAAVPTATVAAPQRPFSQADMSG
jgi:sporulation protein YlmC with PRC-barrel domain